MKKAILTISILVIVGSVFAGQQKLATNPSVADLLASLQSRDWVERAQAYEQLAGDSVAMQKQEVRNALFELLDQENHLLPSAGPKPEDGEAYAEYEASLLGTVSSIADWTDPRQLCILAHAPYNTDSKFAADLAKAGQPILPCLMQMAESKEFVDRYQSVAVLIQIVARNDDLSGVAAQKIRKMTISALHGAEDMVRAGAVNTLSKFGREDMIPALKEVAETDPAPEVQGYSIRKMAIDAIAAIQTRSHK
jgi:hypothetical protein